MSFGTFAGTLGSLVLGVIIWLALDIAGKTLVNWFFYIPRYLVNWFFYSLEADKILYRWRARKVEKILFLGLDNAGKSTLVRMLKDNRNVCTCPTLSPTIEMLMITGYRFRAYDLSGHETVRRIWKDYCASIDGIVFVMDATDRTRFDEARVELHRLLEQPVLAEVPIAVLGNKIDIPLAASEDELRNLLGLSHMSYGRKCYEHDRSVELFMTSVVKRLGYAEAFEWLSHRLHKGTVGEFELDWRKQVAEMATWPEFVVQVRGTIDQQIVRVTCTSLAGDELKVVDIDAVITWSNARRLVLDGLLCPGFRPVFITAAGLVLTDADGSKSIGEILAPYADTIDQYPLID